MTRPSLAPALLQDRPGFIVNRILMPMVNEAFFALMEVRCSSLPAGGQPCNSGARAEAVTTLLLAFTSLPDELCCMHSSEQCTANRASTHLLRLDAPADATHASGGGHGA